jgi:hypothetical protein
VGDHKFKASLILSQNKSPKKGLGCGQVAGVLSLASHRKEVIRYQHKSIKGLGVCQT